MLKIGDFSKVAQVSVKTLRYYADLGLLKPAYVDRYTSYRYYTLEQLPRLNRILALKELGFSLIQIDRLLHEDLPPQELQRLMRLKQAELQEQVQAEQARLARVEARLRQIEREGRQPRYEVVLKRVAPCIVAGIRDTIGGYGELGSLVGELQSYLAGRESDPTAACLAIYYDAEYREQGVDVEVAVPVDRRLRGSSRVRVHELPGAETMASLVYQGSYDAIGGAYRSLMGWTQANGYRSGGPNREIYLLGPGPGRAPPGYVTELQLPVESITARAIRQGKEGQIMEPRIVTKPAFTVVGVPFKGLTSAAPYENGGGNNEIGKAWDVFNRRFNEIRNVSGPAIGLCFGMPNPSEPWYIAGIEVSRPEDVPPDMMSMSVPECKYAVFTCTLPTLGETYRRIMEEWQPQSGYEHGEAPDFEVYDEKFNPEDPEHGEMHVYWPLK